jgi:glycosyltransferase involved in cell wall biosynthesis
MLNVILLATAWGPRHGGINSFNRSFALGLKKQLGAEGRIICVVPSATDEELSEAAKHNVELLRIPEASSSDQFDRGCVEKLGKSIPPPIEFQSTIWVGHDVISGDAARSASELLGGRVALVMHMDYLAYQGILHTGETAWEKHERQVKLFQGAPTAFAVGPLLQRSCNRLIGTKRTHRLIPGFPITEPNINISPDDLLVAIMLGRVDAEHDRLKQGKLTVAAFSAAVAHAREWSGRTPLSDGILTILGLNEDPETRNELFKNSEKHAQQLINVLPARFTEDIDLAINRIRKSNLAFMLSWHEGFGLVGWEAIACEVPLILSVNSGLFELIDEELGGAGVGCLHGIRIEGSRQEGQNFSDADIASISKIIHRISANLARAKNDAKQLKRMLLEKLTCTWDETARQFLEPLEGDQYEAAGSELGYPLTEDSSVASGEAGQLTDADAGASSAEDDVDVYSVWETLSVEAKREAAWTNGTGPDLELDKLIIALKTHNWYAQNPAVKDARRLLREKPDADPSQVFLLGRNIYQAADGKANEALLFLVNLTVELGRFPLETRRFLLLGMLYEVYFNARDEVRNIPKAGHVEFLFQAASSDDFAELASQLRVEMARRAPGRYPILPGQTGKALKVDFTTESPEDEVSPLVLVGVAIGNITLACQTESVFDDTTWGQLRKYGKVVEVDDILEIIQDYFAIPKAMLAPSIDTTVTLTIDDNLSLFPEHVA